MEELEPGLVVEEETGAEARLAPRFNVILWDDNDHTYDYVIDMLQRLFAKTLQEAYLHAKNVDTAGRTILLTTSLEHAELKRDQIHSFGPDHRIERCKGSMSASIEPFE